jgi:DNA-binding XRE family transcriptional regulator
VGVTDQTVSNWEAGRFEPRLTISQMQALCRVLQCSLDELPSFTEAEESE